MKCGKCKRVMICVIVQSILLYGALLWTYALKMEKHKEMLQCSEGDFCLQNGVGGAGIGRSCMLGTFYFSRGWRGKVE